MNMEDAINYLSTLVKDKPWFYDLKALDPRRIVVYTLYQSGDILREIPDNINGYQVLVHFTNKQKTKKDNPYIGSYVSVTTPCGVLHNSVPSKELNISKLISELDRLEKICGVNALESIFYEEHDGKNCITNLSSKYPDVRSSIHVLYEKYGFDVIYEEIER